MNRSSPGPCMMTTTPGTAPPPAGTSRYTRIGCPSTWIVSQRAIVAPPRLLRVRLARAYPSPTFRDPPLRKDLHEPHAATGDDDRGERAADRTGDELCT